MRVLNWIVLTMLVMPFTAVTAFAQDTTTESGSVTTTTTETTSEWITDWRLWAAVGALLVIILVVALTRGGGNADRTTIVK